MKDPGMKIKSLILFAAVSLVFLTACSEEQKFTKGVEGQWWPVHAKGSIDNDVYSAKWDGDLDDHGGIVVTYVSKSDPSRVIKQTKYYPAYIFGKDNRRNDAVRILDIRSLYEIVASKYLKYKVEDGILYIEKINENGTPTGEFDSGRPYTLKDKTTLVLGDVTYMEFTHYKELHPNKTVSELSGDSGLIPIMVYE